MNRIIKILIQVLLLVTLTTAFKDLNDGARIIGKELEKQNLEGYAIPLRNQRKESSAQHQRIAGVLNGFDDAEYTLLSQMKKMETPPNVDAVDYYAENKQVGSRFNGNGNNHRSARSVSFGESGGPSTSSSSRSPTSSIAFDSSSGKGGSSSDKRIFPELFGIPPPQYYSHHGGHGHHGNGHHYPGGNYGGIGGNYGGYPHYPTGGYYGNPGYHPGAGGGYYPGVGGYHPGGFGNGGSSAAAAASASSSSGYRPGGLYGNNYYGGGYGNGFYPHGGVSPILGSGIGTGSGIGPVMYPHYPGFVGGGFFRDEDGNKGVVSGAAALKMNEDGGDKSKAVSSDNDKGDGKKVTFGDN